MISTEDLEEIIEALKDANAMCRSAVDIAKREGLQTNWRAFYGQLYASLKMQHEALLLASHLKEGEG